MTEKRDKTIRFDLFVLDCGGRHLSRDAEGKQLAVILSKQAMDLLIHFAERPNRIVARSDLLHIFSTVENSDDFEDCDRTIQKGVNRLKQSLGNDGKALIKTCRKEGWKFCPSLIEPTSAQNQKGPTTQVEGEIQDNSDVHFADHPLSVHLIGECYYCGKKRTFHPVANRFCCAGALPVELQEAADQGLLPTVYPVPKSEATEFAPPSPFSGRVTDGFAASFSMLDGKLDVETDTFPSPYPKSNALLPFRCGHCAITNLGSLGSEFGFESDKIQVCDMSTYQWSSTLKDPRSWAVVNLALACGIRHLGVWTAGNAGLSLTKIVHRANQSLAADQRITVYCYASDGDLSPELQHRLRSFNAVVELFQRPDAGMVFRPDQVLQSLNRRLQSPIPSHEFWDVSDGWDGIGLYMYRLLARQLITHMRPRYLVVPVGTGNLFLGFFWGLRDCVNQSKLANGECTLLGAVPNGDSVVTNLRQFNIELPILGSNHESKPPVAPKLATIYTPLLLLALDAVKNHSSLVRLYEVSLKQQQQAAKLLRSAPERWRIASEPSALVAFGALNSLSRHILNEKNQTKVRPSGLKTVQYASDSVLVVNTGNGAVSSEERAFFDDL